MVAEILHLDVSDRVRSETTRITYPNPNSNLTLSTTFVPHGNSRKAAAAASNPNILTLWQKHDRPRQPRYAALGP